MNMNMNMNMNITNLKVKDINIQNKIKAFEIKLSTYIDIYNITYASFMNYINDNDDNDNDNDDDNDDDYEIINDKIIKYNNIKLEKIGNIEIIYRNFHNTNKHIAKQLHYSIYQLNFIILFDKFQYILNEKGYTFNFINYSYNLYNVIGIDNMYIIHTNSKGNFLHFEDPCIIFIFIRDKLFLYNYNYEKIKI